MKTMHLLGHDKAFDGEPLSSSVVPRAFIYGRASAMEQAGQDARLGEQERVGRGLCEAKGIAISDVFLDQGLSGVDRDRPELTHMMLQACGENRPVDYIVVSDLSRLARDIEFIAIILARLKRAGVKVLSAQ